MMSVPLTSLLMEEELAEKRKKTMNEEEADNVNSDAVNAADLLAGSEAEINIPNPYIEFIVPEVKKEKHPAANKSEPPPTGTITRIRLPHIPSIPNMRALLWDRRRNPVVFRSARHECIAFEDVKTFMEFDIKTIIDLRSCHEYSEASGNFLLDRLYPVFDVDLPKDAADFSGKDPKSIQVSHNFPDDEIDLLRECVRPEMRDTKRRRYLIPICNKQFFINLAKQTGQYHVLLVRGVADMATFFKYGFLTRHFVNHFNDAGQWRLYVSYLECGANAFVAALKIINEPDNLPVLFNCHVGKDRTGVLAALLLTLVGVSRSDVLRDFSRSEDGIQHVRDEIRDYMNSQNMYWNEEFLHAFPDDMAMTFEYIEDKYGSVNNFLHANGFTYEEQARLKDNLLTGSRNSFSNANSGFVFDVNKNSVFDGNDDKQASNGDRTQPSTSDRAQPSIFGDEGKEAGKSDRTEASENEMERASRMAIEQKKEGAIEVDAGNSMKEASMSEQDRRESEISECQGSEAPDVKTLPESVYSSPVMQSAS